jgi:hypothetical protein
MTETVLGVTGTRGKPTMSQLRFLYTRMTDLHETLGCRTLHHGCCTGWDEAAHWLARSLGWKIVVHPPTNRLYEANDPLEDMGWDVEHRQPKPYAERNQDIVNESTVLYAGPALPEDDEKAKRSGTWMTVRMADKKRMPWVAVLPNGAVQFGEWS